MKLYASMARTKYTLTPRTIFCCASPVMKNIGLMRPSTSCSCAYDARAVERGMKPVYRLVKLTVEKVPTSYLWSVDGKHKLGRTLNVKERSGRPRGRKPSARKSK